jgi:DNA-binding CsgD family transcriptional regulator/predicted transcriptional regulator
MTNSTLLPELFDSSSRLPAMPSHSLSAAPKPLAARKRYTGYYSRKSRAIYELQVREYVVQRRNEGATFGEISRELDLSLPTVRAYYRKSITRAVSMIPFNPETSERFDEDQPYRRDRQRQRQKRAQRSSQAQAPGPHTNVHMGDVLDPPDEIPLRQEALRLAKACVPYDEISARLGISEKEARQFVNEELTKLEQNELNGADLQRRLMIEQINAMIAALYAPATGDHPEKGQIAPVFEAVDRMMKLLKQKADLIGLGQPQYEDIRMVLQALAEEQQYDMLELEDIARAVLSKHRIKLPGF